MTGGAFHITPADQSGPCRSSRWPRFASTRGETNDINDVTGTHLGLASALQDVHQCTRHLLLVLDTNPGLEHRAQQHVVIGGVFSKLLVHLHGKDVHTLIAGLDSDHRSRCFALRGVGRADWIPLLHKLSPGNGCDGDVDESNVIVLIFLLLLVRVLVQVGRDALDSRQVVELKVLPPKDVVSLELAGGAGVQRVIQTELTEVFLFGWQVLGLDDPQPQQVLNPATVVLQGCLGSVKRGQQEETLGKEVYAG